MEEETELELSMATRENSEIFLGDELNDFMELESTSDESLVGQNESQTKYGELISQKFQPSAIWKRSESHEDSVRASQDDCVRYIMSGRLNNLPPARSKVVRVFLSSTFTDMSVERNALIKNTFPKLKAYLRDKFDLEFQVVDMRWGVRHDAVIDHSSSDLCMREIQMCQRLSIGPTFVTFLGQRYGSRPLPARIDSEEMNLLLSALKPGNKQDEVVPPNDLLVLEKWYQQDENAVPPHYVLQPVSSMGGGDSGSKLWKEAEPVLARTLRKASQTCLDQGTMTLETRHKYVESVTDEEVLLGLLKDKSPDAHCLCFMRTLENINLKHMKAKRFIDLTDSGDVDAEAQTLLQQLCDVKIKDHLSKDNQFKFTIPWSDEDGVNTVTHAAYLEEFCRTFENAIMKLTIQGVKKSRELTTDKLYVEILEHAHQSANKCERFFGRKDILDTIEAYVLSESQQPLVVHGESGCGKTSLMAKAAQLTPDWLGNDPDLAIVLRFLGTTPDTSSISTTLTSICEQIYRNFPLSDDFAKVPLQFSDLKDFFLDILDAIPTQHRLVVYLDSLDQLAAANNAHNIKWLPIKLPSNVKLVLSTLPMEHSILDNLRSTDIKEENYIIVGSLKPEDSLAIVQLWLKQAQRQITEDQMPILKQAIRHDVRPLFLKLIFDSVVQWKSYQISITDLPGSIKQSIKQLFVKLEQKHGDLLVSRAFGYLTASKNGLTETEMEDILSLDDDVLNDVFQFHVPPTRRLPSILWSRIRADISEYIVDRETDGAKVMAWYHRQFIESAERYFPSNKFSSHAWKGNNSETVFTEKSKETMVQNLVDYFLGTFSNGKKKSFQYTNQQMKKLQLSSPESDGDRFVPDQPCVFVGSEGELADIEHIRYNRRKISELPHALDLIKSDSVRNKLELLVFNVEFLMSWVATQPWSEISDYIEEQVDTDGDEEDLEKELLKQCMLLSYTTLYANPLMMGPSLSGRILMYKDNMKLATAFIEQADSVCRKYCALLPPHMNLDTPGGELLYVINNHNTSITDCNWGGGGEIFVSVSDKVVIINMQMGQVMADVRPRSVPHHEVFHKVCTFPYGGIDQCAVIATLREKPWVYAFESTEGHLLYEAHLDLDPAFENYNISGIYPLEGLLLIWSKGSNNLVYLKSTDGSMSSKYEGSSGAQFLFPLEDERILVAWEGSSGYEILKYDEETGKFYKRFVPLKTESGQLNIFCHTDYHPIDGEMHSTGTALATTDGELFLLDTDVDDLDTDDSSDDDDDNHDNSSKESDDGDDKLSKQSTAKKPLMPVQVDIPDTDGFFPHYMTMQSGDDDKTILVAAFETQLIILQIEEREEDAARESKVVLRIKKRYDKFGMSNNMTLLYAYAGGTVDVFGLNHDVGLRAKLIVTLEAHSRPITKLLPVDEGALFMSSAEDGSLKFWNMEKSKNSKMIPSFDRTRESIQKIDTFTFMEDANCFAIVTGAPGSPISTLSVWNIVTGKLLCEMKPSRAIGFVSACIVHKWKEQPVYKLVAVNVLGDVLVWDITLVLKGALMGQVEKLPSPIICHGCLPKDKAGSLICIKPTLDGGKAIAVSSNGSWFLLDIFQANEEKFIINSHTRDISDIVYDLVEVTIDGKIIAVGKRGDDVVLHAVDFLKGRDIFNEGLSDGSDPIDKCVVRAMKYVQETGLAALVVERDGRSSLKVFDIKGTCAVIDVPVPIGKGYIKSMATTQDCIAMTCDTSLHLFDLGSKAFTLSRAVDKNLGDVCLSPDGQYMVYIVNQKEVFLIRMSNKAVLAWYTMSVQVTCVSISCNGWYVVMGTEDRRVFVLIIGDPDEDEHTERIKFVRKVNPGLAKEEVKGLTEEIARAMSSDDELDIDFDEAGSVIDMDVTNRRRVMSRNYSKLTAGMLDDLTSDEDDLGIHSKPSSGIKERLMKDSCVEAEVLMMSSELCSLQ